MLENIEQQLLVRPRAFADENVSGYLARLAWVNGFASSTKLLASLDIPLQHESVIEARNTIFYRLGCRELRASRCDEHFQLLEYQRICPQCFREANYFREIWDFALLPICLIHGKRLRAGCLRCQRLYSRCEMPFTNCSCDEGNFSNAEASTVSQQSLGLVKLIAQQLGFNQPEIPNNYPAILHRLDADTLQRIVLLLGSYRVNSISRRPRKASIKSNIDSAADVIEAAADTLTHWPSGLMPFLAASASDLPINRGLRQSVGHAYTALSKGFVGEAREFLVEGFEHCLSLQWREHLENQSRNISLASKEYSSCVPATPFARAYGVSVDRLLNWIEQGHLEGQVRRSRVGRRLGVLRLGQDERIRQLMEGWSLEATAKAMGLPECRLREMLEDKYVAGTAPRKGAQWSIDPEEIIRLRNALISVSLISPPCESISLNYTFRCRLPGNQRFPPLFQAILNREIGIYVEVPGRGALIHDVVLNKNDLEKWLRIDGLLSITDVAKELKIHMEVAYRLIDRGLIPHTQTNRLGRRVSREALELFKQQFIFGREIAKLQNTSSKKIARLMESLGVIAFSGPKVDGGRQYLYRREAVASILPALLNKEPHVQFPAF